MILAMTMTKAMTHRTTAFVFLACVLSAPFAVPQAAAQSLGGSDTTEISENIYSFRFGGGRSLWVEMNDSVVVFDPQSTSAAAALKESIREATDKPVRYVIYTHEHYDHIRGAKTFADDGAIIVSQENCLDTFDYVPDPDAIPPDVTYADRFTVPLEGTQIELLYFGRNHGDCMTITHFPEHRMIFMVDMLTDKSLPFGSMPDPYPGDMVRTLAEVEKLDFDRIARGHRSPVVDRAVLDGTLGYWSDLMTTVKAALNAGTPAIEVMQTLELPKYRAWTNYDRWIRLHVERAVWHYAIGW
jgi:glyoxylase-like metal-dependent hydrolase (beta-lactamase superfamily II)